MISLAKLDKLQEQADTMKASLLRMSASCGECAVISVVLTLFDEDGTMNGFQIAYYPQGQRNFRNVMVFDYQTPLDIKAFTDAHPEIEYFINWNGCLEWKYAHANADGNEDEKQRLDKWFKNLWDYRTDLLISTLAAFPPVMHYIGNRKENNNGTDKKISSGSRS